MNECYFIGMGQTGRLGSQHIQYMIIIILEHLYKLKVNHDIWLGYWLYNITVQQNNFVYNFDPIVTNKEGFNFIKKFKDIKLQEEIELDDYEDTNHKNLFSGNMILKDRPVFYSSHIDTQLLGKYKDLIRQKMSFKKKWKDIEKSILKNFGNKKIVCLHIRRAEFVMIMDPHYQFYISMYFKWLTKNFDFGDHVLYVCGDYTKKDLKYLSNFFPKTIEDLNYTKKNFDWFDILVDQIVLRNASYILGNNSMFSFTASMLNEKEDLKCYRPNFYENFYNLVEYDPWKSKTHNHFSFLKGFVLTIRFDPFIIFKLLYFMCKKMLSRKPLFIFSYNFEKNN